MSKRKNVAYAQISVFVHATEDRVKVLTAMKNLLPILDINSDIESTEMLSHHGNPIVKYETALYNRRKAFEALHNLLSRFSSLDEEMFRKDILRYLDEKGRLYLRFNKQQAFLGRVALENNDPISVKIRLGFKPKTLDQLKNYIESKL